MREADFTAHVDKLSEDAFDDQCTGANPRYPLISELKQVCWIPTTVVISPKVKLQRKKDVVAAPKAGKSEKIRLIRYLL